MSPEKRQALYQVVAAVLPLLAAYGFISESQAGMWVALAAAILTSPVLFMAARHVPDAPDGGKWRRGKRVE